MTESIRIKRLRGASIFKLYFFGTCISFILLCTVLGVPAFFGAEVLSWNQSYVTGVTALIAAPFMGLFIGAIFGAVAGLAGYAGLRILSMFHEMELEYIPATTKDA